MTGTLYIVATPIGNLRDITLRAVDVLTAASRILAEDTRRTRALLNHLGISGKPVSRFDAHASDADVSRAIEHLAAGETTAIVTDAGTPVVSDPGSALIRAAAVRGIPVVPIPGPSALTAAVSISGLVEGPFWFLGFYPRTSKSRDDAAERIVQTTDPVVFFEAPTRIAKTLSELAVRMPHREAIVARELTKLHEEVLRGQLGVIAADAAREYRGEITVVLGSMTIPKHEASPGEVQARIFQGLGAGMGSSEIAEVIRREFGMPKKEAYTRVLQARKSRGAVDDK